MLDQMDQGGVLLALSGQALEDAGDALFGFFEAAGGDDGITVHF
jgi:hypothetical protein